MERAEDILINARGITKLYEIYVEDIRKDNQLSIIELAIIVFLYNNPEQDTASDIANAHMLQKGNISQGVDMLIKKDYLKRIPDVTDRRRIHLSVTDFAMPVINSVLERRKKLMDKVFDGFTEDERNIYTELNMKIHLNILKGLIENN